MNQDITILISVGMMCLASIAAIALIVFFLAEGTKMKDKFDAVCIATIISLCCMGVGMTIATLLIAIKMFLL